MQILFAFNELLEITPTFELGNHYVRPFLLVTCYVNRHDDNLASLHLVERMFIATINVLKLSLVSQCSHLVTCPEAQS